LALQPRLSIPRELDLLSGLPHQASHKIVLVPLLGKGFVRVISLEVPGVIEILYRLEVYKCKTRLAKSITYMTTKGRHLYNM